MAQKQKRRDTFTVQVVASRWFSPDDIQEAHQNLETLAKQRGQPKGKVVLDLINEAAGVQLSQ